MPVAVLCVIYGSDKENMFSGIENLGRRCRAARWVTRRNYCLRSTMGGIQYANSSVGFGIGSIEGFSKFHCVRCCFPGILVTG